MASITMTINYPDGKGADLIAALHRAYGVKTHAVYEDDEFGEQQLVTPAVPYSNAELQDLYKDDCRKLLEKYYNKWARHERDKAAIPDMGTSIS